MSLMIKILSVIGCILLAVVLLLVWIIIMPRHFWVEYCKADGVTVKMNIGPFKLSLVPLPDIIARKMEKKETDTEQTDKKTAETVKKQPPEEKTGMFDDIQLSMKLIKETIAAAKGLMKKIIKAIKFRDVSFTAPVHHSDVLKTQQMYGAVTSSFYALAIYLQKHLQITFKSPVFVADFADRYKESVYFYTQITASPVLLLAAVWYGYKQYTFIMENNKKAPDAAEKENNNG